MNHYELLEVLPTASIETIEAAYRVAIKKYHPDIFKGDKNFAEIKMKELNEAVETLRNKRREYDETIETAIKEPEEPHSNIDNLLEFVFIFLEEGDFKRANEYCERVLSKDSKNAKAYIGKLCAELNIQKEADLANHKEPLENISNYKTALSFADSNYRVKLTGYNQTIQERCHNALIKQKTCAITEDDYKELSKNFLEMNGYKNTKNLANECEIVYQALKKEREHREKLHIIEQKSNEFKLQEHEYSFDDIRLLDDMAIQVLVSVINPRVLGQALSMADDDLKEVFFKNMSKRNAEKVQEGIEYARGKHTDILAAQQRIVDTVIELELQERRKINIEVLLKYQRIIELFKTQQSEQLFKTFKTQQSKRRKKRQMPEYLGVLIAILIITIVLIGIMWLLTYVNVENLDPMI